MRRPLLMGIVALTTATALILAAAAAAFRPPPPVPIDATPGTSAATAASRATVDLYYAGVNHAIATGDLSQLDTILSPDFSERDATGRATPGRDPLHRDIRALYETDPTAKLSVESIVAEGEWVVATVWLDRTGGGNVIGLRLVAPALWSPTEAFHIVASQVVERTIARDDLVMVEPLVETPIALNAGAEFVDVRAMRFIIPPGGERTGVDVAGVRLVLVESGTLSITATFQGGDPVDPPAITNALSTGASVIHQFGAAYTARNTGTSPAVLVDVLVLPLSPLNVVSRSGSTRTDQQDHTQLASTSVVAQSVPTRDQDILSQSEASSPDTGVEIVSSTPVISIGRATLAPGARLSWEAATGPAMLLVSNGSLGVRVTGDPAQIRRGVDGRRKSYDQAVLISGDSAFVAGEESATIENLGDTPTTLIVVTLANVMVESASASTTMPGIPMS